MNDVLLALHLIGLMMGAGGGFGSMITQREARTRSPEQQGALRSLGPAMASFSALGLVIMWLTGAALVFTKYHGVAGLPGLFWVKAIFIATLTFAAIALHVTYRQLRAGDAAAASRLPVLGPIAGASSLLAVVAAVFAFH